MAHGRSEGPGGEAEGIVVIDGQCSAILTIVTIVALMAGGIIGARAERKERRDRPPD